MTRTQIYLPDELYTSLKLLAESENVGFSDLIREGAKTLIAKRQKKTDPLLKLIGIGRNKNSSIGQNIDEIYIK